MPDPLVKDKEPDLSSSRLLITTPLAPDKIFAPMLDTVATLEDRLILPDAESNEIAPPLFASKDVTNEISPTTPFVADPVCTRTAPEVSPLLFPVNSEISPDLGEGPVTMFTLPPKLELSPTRILTLPDF